MNRKKHFLLILTALVLMFTMAFALVACSGRDTGANIKKEPVDKDALIANGSFAGVESGKFPKVPSNWTGTAGSTVGTTNSAQQGKDVKSGVINVSSSSFDNKDYLNAIKINKNPGKPKSDSKDNSVLMINNIKPSSYSYVSSSTTLEKNSYYQITMYVKTYGEATAFMYVLGSAFAEFKNIDTNGAWARYEVYVETAVNTSKSINITLSNGWGDNKTGVMSKGAVFFDEVTATKIEKSVYDSKVLEDASVDNNIATYSMKKSDSEFNYTSGSTNPFTPAKYRSDYGRSENGNSAPHGYSSVSHGIVDTTLDFSKLNLEGAEVPTGTLGNKMLFIKNIEKTAFGYKSTEPFVLEAGKNYTLKILLKTIDVSANGATLRLVRTSDDAVDKDTQFNKINTNGEWKEYTFNIKADDLTTKEIYFELWLGEGGESEKENWSSGTVYMDRVLFEEVAVASSYAMTTSFPAGAPSIDVSYADPINNSKNMIKNGFIMGDNQNGWKVRPEMDPTNEDKDFINSTIAGHKVVTNVLPADNINIITNDNDTPDNFEDDTTTILKHAIEIYVNEPSAYGFVIDNSGVDKLTVEEAKFYKFSMWVKTDMDKKYDGKGLNIRLMQKKDPSDPDAEDKAIASFDNINTREVKENNGYVQVVFYLEGALDKNAEMYLDVTLGAGTRFTPETHVQGKGYVTLVSMEPISRKDYVDARTSTYVKKNSLATSSTTPGSITNGSFDDEDVNTTFDNYEKQDGYIAGADKTIRDGGDFLVPTAPAGWAISNKSYLKILSTGIVSSQAQFERVENNSTLGADFASFNGGDSALVISTTSKSSHGNPNGVLKVPTSPDICGCECEECKAKGVCNGTCGSSCSGEHKCLHNVASGVIPVGYASSPISLSANSFYKVSVRVKAASGNAYVYLTNNQARESVVVKSSANTDWQDVTFYVNTGLSSTSVKLELYLGEYGSKEAVNGTVAFDTAAFSLIDEDRYNAAKEQGERTVEYLTDSFNIENPSTDALNTPNNWKGTGASSESKDLAAGVFEKGYTQSSWLKTYDKDKKTDVYLSDDVFNFLTGVDSDKNFLVINNITPNAYNYVNSSDTKTLTKDAYYEITVKALTYGLKKNETAYITLMLNNMPYSFEINTSAYNDENKETFANKWTEFKFFVKTPANTTVSNVTIKLGLGKESKDSKNKEKDYVQGYAFFDDVTFKNSTKTAFDEATADDKLIKKIEATDEDMKKPAEEETHKKPAMKPETSLLWLYITSGVIAAIIIIVVIVFVINKYKDRIVKFFNKNKTANKATYDKNSNASNTNGNKKNKNEFKD